MIDIVCCREKLYQGMIVTDNCTDFPQQDHDIIIKGIKDPPGA